MDHSKPAGRRRWLASTAIVAAAWAGAGSAFAQDDTAARIEALQAQIEALQVQVEDLKVSTAANIQAVRQDQQVTTVSIANGRPTIASGDGQFTASLRGVMQLDTAQYLQDDNLGASVVGRDFNSGTNFRRGRLGVEGKLYGDFDYNITLDFGGSGTDGQTTLHELWIQYSGFKPAKIRVGAFAPNLGLEDAASTNGSLFPERPSAAEVARSLAGADKRIAAQVLANGDHWLAAAAITGAKAADGATFDEQLGYTFRVAGTPLYGFDWRVHVGANASIVAQPAQATAAGPYTLTLEDRPELRVDGTRLVSTGALDADGARHWGLELAAQKKNWLVQGEYFDIALERRQPAVGVTDPGFTGWYVEAGWVVTGEARKYNTGTAAFDAPPVDKPFKPKAGQWGAWELAARYSVLDLNDNEFSAVTADRVRGGEQAIWSAGVNWFVNPAVRFSLNYLDVSVDRLNSGGVQIGQDYQAVNLRSQFAF
jgi:phosphate-selective porin OprO/OprP